MQKLLVDHVFLQSQFLFFVNLPWKNLNECLCSHMVIGNTTFNALNLKYINDWLVFL